MAQYKEGRVTVTNDSDVVSGTDTQWLSNVDVGDIFLVRGDEVPYRVAAVVSDFSLRLNARYAAPTETNTYYSITRDFTQNFNLPIIRNGDVDAVPLFAEGLIRLDAMLGAGGGGGGGGATTLGGLTDVSVAGALAGDPLTKLANGTYGFVRPYVFTIAFDHAPGDGARIFKSYTGGIVTARRIKVDGGTVSENADDITISIPAPGEANTLASAGSAQSQSLAATKSGVILRTKGIRPGSNITITPEGNDLVIASTGGGTTGGEANTASNVGSGILQLYKSKSGVNLGFRTVALDSSFFSSTLSPDGDTYSLTGVAKPIGSLTDVLLAGASAGQYLRLDSDGNWKAATIPPAGISSVVADPAPILGGNLLTNGRTIIGVRGGYSGHIEKPKAKSYTLDLSSPAARQITSIMAASEQGSINFTVSVNEVAIDGLSGVTSGNTTTLTPAVATTAPVGSKIQLRVNSADALASDFVFSLTYQSA